MAYSLEKIDKLTELESLITMIQKEQDDLDFKKTSLIRRKTSYEEKFTQLGADLSSVNGELTGIDAALASLPDGEVKEDMEARKKKLEYKKFLLEERSEDYGALALIEKEMEIALVDKQLEELVTLLSALETKKGELGG